MVGLHVCGIDHAGQVAVPAGDARAVGFHADGVQVAARDRTESRVPRVTLMAELRGSRQPVEAELIAAGEEPPEVVLQFCCGRDGIILHALARRAFRRCFRHGRGDVSRLPGGDLFPLPPHDSAADNQFEFHWHEFLMFSVCKYTT